MAKKKKAARRRPAFGDEMVQQLADEGVETIFGYSGGAILPTYDAVFRYNEHHKTNGNDPMPLIVPANEQGASFGCLRGLDLKHRPNGARHVLDHVRFVDGFQVLILNPGFNL